MLWHSCMRGRHVRIAGCAVASSMVVRVGISATLAFDATHSPHRAISSSRVLSSEGRCRSEHYSSSRRCWMWRARAVAHVLDCLPARNAERRYCSSSGAFSRYALVAVFMFDLAHFSRRSLYAYTACSYVITRRHILPSELRIAAVR